MISFPYAQWQHNSCDVEIKKYFERINFHMFCGGVLYKIENKMDTEWNLLLGLVMSHVSVTVFIAVETSDINPLAYHFI
jgi:hypothetical protein